MRHVTFYHIAEEWEGPTFMFPLGQRKEILLFFLLVVHTLRDFQAWLKDSIEVLKVQQPNPCTQEQLLSNSDFIGCRNIGQTINFRLISPVLSITACFSIIGNSIIPNLFSSDICVYIKKQWSVPYTCLIREQNPETCHMLGLISMIVIVVRVWHSVFRIVFSS